MAKKVPDRMCVSCREMKPKKELLRVVSDKQGRIYADFSGKAAGRGAYLCSNEDCLNKAKKTKALERVFKKQIPQEIWEEIRDKAERKADE